MGLHYANDKNMGLCPMFWWPCVSGSKYFCTNSNIHQALQVRNILKYLDAIFS